MQCVICGMEVNKNNFGFNASTLVEKNTENDIKSCPFCGVDASFLIREGAYDLSPGDLTDEELNILDHATKLEVFNGEFYSAACQLAKDKHLSYLFKDLSRIEFMHAKVHKSLGNFPQLPKLHKPDYLRLDSDVLLLGEATKREQHAIAFYRKKSALITNPIILKVFDALSQVEKQHEVIALNKIYFLTGL